MILECRHCGAPLDVKEGAALTKCRYCGTVSQRQHMRTIATVTPRDFSPPRQWAPPPQFPADSSKPLTYHGAPRSGIVVLGLLVGVGVSAAMGAGVFLSLRKAPGGGGSVTTMLGGATGEALARASLEQTPANLAKQLSGRAAETSVYVPLSSDRFEYLSISWDAKQPSHPTSFYFAPRKGKVADERLRAALSGRLGGGLNEKGFWSWEGVHLNYQKEGAISGSVTPELSGGPNLHWKRQLQALWKLVVGVAFNQPVAPTPDESLELLGAGYPVAKLVAIDPATTVDNAAASARQKFKGAMASTFITLDVKIAVDHTLLRDVTMSWRNEKGAQMSSVHMSTTSAFAGRREAFIGCLKGQLGAPEVHERDYLKKLSDHRFPLAQGWLWVNESAVSLNPRGNHIAAADWSRALNAIDRCR
ncbi:hypothetical protein [Polyangium aurulentum]|uniref:hypothetical protein n=1 Tax=Polyangium aurulentum TaxID=2567896 RepID=UPI0010ADEE5A|nr:hypothetical protein [Polyangium aurulentum]UQA59010.1 hypothetical protein E8A73_000370 [Polyangium aurulentum]